MQDLSINRITSVRLVKILAIETPQNDPYFENPL